MNDTLSAAKKMPIYRSLIVRFIYMIKGVYCTVAIHCLSAGGSMDPFEEAAPAYAFIPAHPDQVGFSDHMIFGDESPKTGVFGIVAVVAHHPIIIHFEGIAVCGLVVEKDGVVFYFQFIPFIDPDGPFVKGIIVDGQRHCDAFCRYP